MLKLKIGENYLAFDGKKNWYNDTSLIKSTFIPFMIGCFNKKGATCVPLCFDTQKVFNPDNIVKIINEVNANEIYLLSYRSSTTNLKKYKILVNDSFNIQFSKKLKKVLERVNKKVIVVNVNKYLSSREFKIGKNFSSALDANKTTVLSYLHVLEDYKRIKTRYEQIPGEIVAIDNSLKQLAKTPIINDTDLSSNFSKLEVLSLYCFKTLFAHLRKTIPLFDLILKPTEIII